MIILTEPKDAIVQVIGDNIKDEYCSQLRKAVYVIEQSVDGGVILLNLLSGECVFVSNSEKQEAADVLYDKYFYVPIGFDEKTFIDTLRDVLSVTEEVKEGFASYTIFTSTDCNARCFYCYQKGILKKTMPLEMAEDVARFIETTRVQDTDVHLAWFGGEPLFNHAVISKICDLLTTHGIKFSCDMTSNGYLFDTSLIKKAKEEWNLKGVQITLDGTERVYNRIKSYVPSDTNAFARVLRNIACLLEQDIKVTIRLNVDLYNIDDIEDLADYLHVYYGKQKILTVYATPLFEYDRKKKRTKLERAILYERIEGVNKKMFDYGYNDSFLKFDGGISYKSCMSDNNNQISILPDGNLGKCLKYAEENYVGHISCGISNENKIEEFKKKRNDFSCCCRCQLYSICYVLKMCPGSEYCYEEFRDYKIRIIKETMMKKYYDYLEARKNKTSV